MVGITLTGIAGARQIAEDAGLIAIRVKPAA
jgi:hypothetical protein